MGKAKDCFAVFAFVVLLGTSALGQTAEPQVSGYVSNVTRVDSWSYFQPAGDPLALPAEPQGDPDYTYFGDRAELGVRVTGARFDLSGAFNYVRLENLPTSAIGPGGLGDGAFYFAATGLRYSYQLYLGELTATIKSRNRQSSLTVGRMPFTSGTGSNARLQARLIGNFEWSLYQRRFDGARVDIDRPSWHFTGAAFVPTQGGYEESTNLSMPKVQAGAGEWTRKGTNTQYQAFAYLYRDRRGEAAVVDNTSSLDRPVDVTIATFGGSYARRATTPVGEVDAMAWAAVQSGDWYGQPHRGASVAIEAGHRWTSASMRPSLRAGYLFASGDRNADDDHHATFFQMLPSSRRYALSSVYAQMNLSDVVAQLQIEPRRFRARVELHALHLASGTDLWYQGSGATASKTRYFGFSGRQAGGHTGLGTIIEGTLEVPIMKFWSVGGYVGVMSAGEAVRTMFTNQRLTLWSFENTLRFQ